MSGNPTEVLKDDEQGLARAASLLADGGLVAFPTETVYGLGADAGNDRAVAGIFAAKGRPSFNPLIVHVPDVSAAEGLADFDDTARRLASTFWPGALTLVLPLRRGHSISKLVTAGGKSLAVRIPDHPLAQKLLGTAGCPVAAPSANPSGRISPTSAEHVLAGLGGRIDAVVDGGRCGVGLESTIIGVDQGVATLLRPGGLPAEAIEPARRTSSSSTVQCLCIRPARTLSSSSRRLKSSSNHFAPSGRPLAPTTTPQTADRLLASSPRQAIGP